MDNAEQFVDYYDLLKVEPDCNARTLEVAYHFFAKMYHPDSRDTADVDRFTQVVDAYNVLKDPKRRAEYDAKYLKTNGKAPFSAGLADHDAIDEETAASDAEIHAKILLHLYKRRRSHPSDAGIVGWLLQELLDCSEEQFDFHIWYLKAKSLIDVTEQGTLAITIKGVDEVIASARSNLAEKLYLEDSGPSKTARHNDVEKGSSDA
ncbi:DnaJ domain-containing protein [Altererythrobacter aurantiacus]|uniref:DnaJ domain-containing protein n=1 Tax=Parapontixanthobacter aurantiacus TaxID=1463599 RepID=A0A844ZGA3_9SPHN|nr:J domain-containing protein [Parapontixanthobacter aurantiacus]MXO85997.1 DnaJ domain-containing protein [Parapontixanthobacter aurantiacus]